MTAISAILLNRQSLAMLAILAIASSPYPSRSTPKNIDLHESTPELILLLLRPCTASLVSNLYYLVNRLPGAESGPGLLRLVLVFPNTNYLFLIVKDHSRSPWGVGILAIGLPGRHGLAKIESE